VVGASPPPAAGCANCTWTARIDHLTRQIAQLDSLVGEAAAPSERVIARLVTISGTGLRTN
jgi:hypothetical protein